MAHFNPNAPNFFKEGEYYSWRPTVNERAFISEAFELISNDKNETPEGKDVFKFSNNKQSPDNTDDNVEKEPPGLSSFKKANETTDPLKIKAELGVFDNKEIKEEKMTITEYDKQVIDETLKGRRIKEGHLVEDDKEKIIEKILSEKKGIKI